MALTENDIRGHVGSFVESMDKLDETTGAVRHSHEIVARTALIVLTTGLLVDINRIANALEILASPPKE